jgi:hypothetical protein
VRVERVILRLSTLLVAVAIGGDSSTLLAQAMVVEKGQFSFNTHYQHTFSTDHVGHDGEILDLGHIMSWAIRPSLSYGLTDRITVDADISLVAGKYIGSIPHGPLDDGTFHTALQNFHLGARMNVMMRPLFVTPFVKVTIPSHDYQLEGHTAVGKGNLELTAGAYAGRELGPRLPKAYFEIMASHTWVERTVIETDSERLNRTEGSLELGYFVTPSVVVSLFGTGLRTHGGWDLPRHFHTHEEREAHDRFAKLKEAHVGGTALYVFSSGLGIYGGYFTGVFTRSGHVMSGPIAGFTWTSRPRPQWLSSARRLEPVQLAMR